MRHQYNDNPKTPAQAAGDSGVIIGMSLISLLGLGVAGYFIYKSMTEKANAEVANLRAKAEAKQAEKEKKLAEAGEKAAASQQALNDGNAAEAEKLMREAEKAQEDAMKAADESKQAKQEADATAFEVTLTKDQLKKAQQILNGLGMASPLLTVDGAIGPKSRAAIAKFQSSVGLSTDGILSKETFDKLMTKESAIPYGGGEPELITTLEQRKKVQEDLNLLGMADPPLVIDGAFGSEGSTTSKTRKAIRKLQELSKIEVTGLYNKTTKTAIDNAVALKNTLSDPSSLWDKLPKLF